MWLVLKLCEHARVQAFQLQIYRFPVVSLVNKTSPASRKAIFQTIASSNIPFSVLSLLRGINLTPRCDCSVNHDNQSSIRQKTHVFLRGAVWRSWSYHSREIQQATFSSVNEFVCTAAENFPEIRLVFGHGDTANI